MSHGIFDKLERDDFREHRYADEPYEFINRSARPEVARARDLLEAWFSNYAARCGTEAGELRIRCRRGHFNSSFYELFLHELILSLGGDLRVHPTLSESTKKPDFAEMEGAEVAAYVEAHLVTDEDARDRGQDRIRAMVLDAINEIQSCDFFIDLEEINLLSGRQPSVRQIRDGIKADLASLDADELIRAGSVPEGRYRDNNVQVLYRVFAKKPDFRSQSTRMISGPPPEVRHGYSDAPIRRAVAEKARKYGVLTRPLVIALNNIGKWVDEEAILLALFGEATLLSEAEKSWRTERLKSGAFQEGFNTRVSAVLITNVMPWSVSRATVCLYHNPFAKRPYSGVLCGLPQMRFVDGRWERSGGRHVAEIFRLPSRWPWGEQREDGGQ